MSSVGLLFSAIYVGKHVWLLFCEFLSDLYNKLIWFFQPPKPAPQEEETEEERQFRALFQRIAGEVGYNCLGPLYTLTVAKGLLWVPSRGL